MFYRAAIPGHEGKKFVTGRELKEEGGIVAGLPPARMIDHRSQLSGAMPQMRVQIHDVLEIMDGLSGIVERDIPIIAIVAAIATTSVFPTRK